jgi:hypothetical protein
MVRAGTLIVLFVGWCVLGSQTPLEDPVQKARAERAQAQGIGEGDLPPLPKGVVEPPPLPAPETHVKDTRGGSASRVVKTRRGKALARKNSKSKSSASSHASTKPPAKGGRKHKKKVKA